MPITIAAINGVESVTTTNCSDQIALMHAHQQL
jgi:hypothetical protein